jgi:hypothetical protein
MGYFKEMYAEMKRNRTRPVVVLYLKQDKSPEKTIEWKALVVEEWEKKAVTDAMKAEGYKLIFSWLQEISFMFNTKGEYEKKSDKLKIAYDLISNTYGEEKANSFINELFVKIKECQYDEVIQFIQSDIEKVRG